MSEHEQMFAIAAELRSQLSFSLAPRRLLKKAQDLKAAADNTKQLESVSPQDLATFGWLTNDMLKMWDSELKKCGI